MTQIEKEETNVEIFQQLDDYIEQKKKTGNPPTHERQEIVKDNYNGFLCRMKDAADLASKMDRMARLDDNALRLFGENGRRKMEQEFDESLVINKYLQTLIELEKAS